jgi:hypothetical protein
MKDRRVKTAQSVRHALTVMTNSRAKIEMTWSAMSYHNVKSVQKDRRAKTDQSVHHVLNVTILT